MRLNRNQRSNSSGNFPHSIFTPPNHKKLYSLKQRGANIPSEFNSYANSYFKQIANDPTTTHYKLFQMNQLRIECNQLFRMGQHDGTQQASRNAPSKSLAERKRERDCYTQKANNIEPQHIRKYTSTLDYNNGRPEGDVCMTAESKIFQKDFYSCVKLPII